MDDIETAVSPDFGFLVLARKQQLKMTLDTRGLSGLKSLIAACITSGINTEEEILDEVSDITGLHREASVRLLLMECENIDWFRNGDGTFGSLAEPDTASIRPGIPSSGGRGL